MAILNKIDLACYIANRYQNEYGKEISPVKLQKALYFLFAKWGGAVIDMQLEKNKDTEDDEKYESYDTYLFDASFEAWRYGPVDREIYDLYKNNKLISSKHIDSIFDSLDIDYKDLVKEYIDDLLSQVFRISDFGLIDLSCEDKCWKESFIVGKETNMSNDSILRYYRMISAY